MICHDCKQEIPPPAPGTITTGYGLSREGHKVCFACCAKRDKEDMDRTGEAVLYLVKSANRITYEVCNWPGTLRFAAAVHKGRHNFAGVVYNIRFRDHNGRYWHGRCVGNNSEICRCRRYKRRPSLRLPLTIL